MNLFGLKIHEIQGVLIRSSSLPGTNRVKLMYLIKFQCSLWFSELIFDKVGNHKFKLARLARFEHSKCEIFHRNSGSFWYVIKVANFFKRHPVVSYLVGGEGATSGRVKEERLCWHYNWVKKVTTFSSSIADIKTFK